MTIFKAINPIILNTVCNVKIPMIDFLFLVMYKPEAFKIIWTFFILVNECNFGTKVFMNIEIQSKLPKWSPFKCCHFISSRLNILYDCPLKGSHLSIVVSSHHVLIRNWTFNMHLIRQPFWSVSRFTPGDFNNGFWKSGNLCTQ